MFAGALKIDARILFVVTQITTRKAAEIKIEGDENGSKLKNDNAAAAKTKKIK